MAKRTLKVIEAEIKENIKAFNEAYGNEDMAAISAANAKQDALEKEYAELAEVVCYSALKKQENPMLAAIKQYGYEVLKHKDIVSKEKIADEDGEEEEITTITRELTSKEKQIDLIKFDNHGKKKSSVDPLWRYEMQTLNQLFCIRTAQELNVPFEAKSYHMDKMARRIDNGETPTSNTAMLDALQKLIDMVIFEGKEDNDKANKYRANSRDVTAILMQYTKSGKGRLGIAPAKHNYFARLIGKVLYRIATGEQYSLEYTISKDAKK